jgi:hypothetical protein
VKAGARRLWDTCQRVEFRLFFSWLVLSAVNQSVSKIESMSVLVTPRGFVRLKKQRARPSQPSLCNKHALAGSRQRAREKTDSVRLAGEGSALAIRESKIKLDS